MLHIWGLNWQSTIQIGTVHSWEAWQGLMHTTPLVSSHEWRSVSVSRGGPRAAAVKLLGSHACTRTPGSPAQKLILTSITNSALISPTYLQT